eukprot:gene22396-biopygen18870
MPFADLAAVADGGVLVVDLAIDERHEAVRVHGGRIARRDVVAADATPPERGAGCVARLRAGREVQLARGAGRVVAIHVQGLVLRLGVADDAHAVRVRPVRAAPVQVFAGNRDAALVAQGDAAVGGRQVILAVAGRILAVAGHRFAAQAFLQFDVDHARDGVRAVLGGGAVAQHLHVLDRQQRNRIHVRARVAAVARAEQIDEGRRVAPLAVHQHEGLVRAEAAQGGRIDQVGPVRARLARGVERGGNVLQGLRQVKLSALLGHLGNGDDIDRHHGVRGGTGDPARADHADRLHGAVRDHRIVALCHGGGAECGQGGAAVQAGEDGLTQGGEGRHAVSPSG